MVSNDHRQDAILDCRLIVDLGAAKRGVQRARRPPGLARMGLVDHNGERRPRLFNDGDNLLSLNPDFFASGYTSRPTRLLAVAAPFCDSSLIGAHCAYIRNGG